MKFGFYWPYATRSLVRGGQRTVLAIFCIAVGVMAIVALQLVGLSINNALTSNVVAANGGDLRLTAPIIPLQTKDLATFDQLKQTGQITNYATSSGTGGTITTSSGSVELIQLLAVSPNFPLVGQPQFTQPSRGLRVQDIVSGGNVAISNIVASDLGAHIGGTYQIVTNSQQAITMKVSAIYQSGGAFTGKTIIVSEATLATAPGPKGALPQTFDTVYMTVPAANLKSVESALSTTFPLDNTISAQDELQQRQTQVSEIRLFLQIVGLVALFIGGIGIINTMQVLLRRRRVEIAMLKTAGYQQNDLFALFGLEAGLLGFMGGVVGTGLGIGASYIVSGIVSQAVFVNLPITLDTGTIVAGILIGFFTALIFGLLPIIQASQVRPLAVLRESEEQTATSTIVTGGLLVLLSVLFVALAASIIGDLVKAILVVYGGALLIFAMAAGFALLVQAISRLPVYERPRGRAWLWVLASFGILLVTAIVSALIAGAGFVATLIASRLGNSSLGSYIVSVLTMLALVLLGGAIVYFLANLVNIAVMYLPRSWKTPVMLAYRNMGRQWLRTTTTLTALFVGVFAIGAVVVVGNGIRNDINSAIGSVVTHNVFVEVSQSQASAVQPLLTKANGVDPSKTQVNTVATVNPVSINGQSIITILESIPKKSGSGQFKIGREELYFELASLEGFNLKNGDASQIQGIISSGRNLGPADAGTNNVVVSSRLSLAPLNLKVGDTITVASVDGKVTQNLTVVGFFNGQNFSASASLFGTVLGDTSLLQNVGGPTFANVYSLKVDPNSVANLRGQLVKAAPQAQVISLGDITNLIGTILNSIIEMLSAIASLALIAGLIIIANAVALAMLERRREIGILKSVGHTSNSILATVLVENGLVGLLGSGVAILLVGGAVTLLSVAVFQAGVTTSIGLSALIVGLTTVVTMTISALVAWSATRVRPLEVLRYE